MYKRQDYKDAWFCGYSRYYTTSVWVGCDDPKPMDNLTGSSYPSKIFSDYMTKVHKGKDVYKRQGKYYTVGSHRIEYTRYKHTDDRFFILTLMAVAKEIKRRGLKLSLIHIF